MGWINIFVSLLLHLTCHIVLPLRITSNDRWNQYVDPYFNLSNVHVASLDGVHHAENPWEKKYSGGHTKYLDQFKENANYFRGSREDAVSTHYKSPGHHTDASLRWMSQEPQSDIASPPNQLPDEFAGAFEFSRNPNDILNSESGFPSVPQYNQPVFQPRDIVWNENGQFWGYARDTQYPQVNDALYWPYGGQSDTISDPDCIPPFCIPINCGQADPEKCHKSTSITVSCTGNDCDNPCGSDSPGTRRCVQNDPPCREGLFGDQCHFLHPIGCNKLHALICQYGCGPWSRNNQVICLCNPLTRNTTKSTVETGKPPPCLSTTDQQFTCPLDCTGKGQCDPSTRTCRCDPGYEGSACEKQVISTPSTMKPSCPSGLIGPNCDLDIDECLSRANNCEQNCVNTYGSFRCDCSPGYKIDPQDQSRCLPDTPNCYGMCVSGQGRCVQGNKCLCQTGFEGEYCEQDIDECQTGRHQCQQLCYNKHGSYECRCYPGYEVDTRNPYSCLLIQCNPPCAEPQGRCNAQGQCECQPGFTGPDCGQDVDECASGQHNCEQHCINTHGSYRCDCEPGYKVDLMGQNRCRSDGHCDPRCLGHQAECQGKRCLNGGSCRLIGHQHECICPFGYHGNRCELDVDECAPPSGLGYTRCEHTCVNILGSYTCTCRQGYRLQMDGQTCLPERQEVCPGGCLNGGICIISTGQCECPHGFQGQRCEHRVQDACKTVNKCEYDCVVEFNGNVRCTCPGGYELQPDGKSCARHDSCPDGCHNGGYCFQDHCVCTAGFEGPACEVDRDECANPAAVHGCQYGCQNTVGSYECICPDGQRRLEDRRTCVADPTTSTCNPPCKNGGVCAAGNQCQCLRGFEGVDCSQDIDECNRFRPCDSTRGECLNRPGWYECTCKPGYRLTVDGHQCIEVWRALENPSLVFRGRSQKGIVVANPLGSSFTQNQDVITFTNPRGRRMKRRPETRLAKRGHYLKSKGRQAIKRKGNRSEHREYTGRSVVILNTKRLQ